MTATQYKKILSALVSASRVLDDNVGELDPADMRIRCLVNITTKETKRALADVGPDANRSPDSIAPLPAVPAQPHANV